MAEAIGLIASVLQLAGTGLKLSQALYQYADAVATADRRIREIAKEIRLTSSVVEELGNIFKQHDTLSLMSDTAVATANETIVECSGVFEDIEKTLNKSKKGKMGRFMLPFRENKIELLQNRIEKLKSSLQLLMQVLMHAYQVASNRLDREAEAKQRDEIKKLIEKKRSSTQKYEELRRKLSMSDSSTAVEDEQSSLDEESVSGSTFNAAAIGSSIDPESLAECAEHVRILLEDIGRLQQALASKSDGDDHSANHQMVIGSYFTARSHLDRVLLGSSKTVALETRTQNMERLSMNAPILLCDSESGSGPNSGEIRVGVEEAVSEKKTQTESLSIKTPKQNQVLSPSLGRSKATQGRPNALFGGVRLDHDDMEPLCYQSSPYSGLLSSVQSFLGFAGDVDSEEEHIAGAINEEMPHRFRGDSRTGNDLWDCTHETAHVPLSAAMPSNDEVDNLLREWTTLYK